MLNIPNVELQEKEKYSEIWNIDEYKGADSPGLENVKNFIKVLNPPSWASVIDLGCGSGLAGIELEKLGFDTWYLDITSMALLSDVNKDKFIESPLWKNWGNAKHFKWEYGYCCDVLEHIPTEYVMLCVSQILRRCEVAWLHISQMPDKFGPLLLGEDLHLTVRPFTWWLLRLQTLGEVTDARDLCETGLFVVRSR